ncbi:phosphate ABC transporter permease subunit PstC [Tamilnaduibacter salinus]|uniref:Phosphate transport system permease protein n=1 Tax=Tamilnaduibacter salinus TaxID=1484056 RepID=A0A2A2I3A4_9GAMM|nr:phosphate ABC transporter permease subunit PstC [Tamilnaduibacter salinus]PAV26117.1 phosphate ABC transporter permease subunit PstC [Tamilnaduibacter salinus]
MAPGPSRDTASRAVILTTGFTAALISALILAFLLIESAPMLESGQVGAFFSDADWHPRQGQFGLWPMIAGSLVVTALAVLIASPLALASALFMRFYAPGVVAVWYRRLLELMAGIPSVVFGFWGLITLVPLIGHWGGSGASILTGALVLALMILPLVALSSDSSLERVPPRYWQAGQALGLSRWGLIVRVMIPAAMPGIIGGLILQTGRALGETMAVLMVTGNVVQFPGSLLEPARTLTANIALEMSYATGSHRSALFVSGLVLFVASVALVAIAVILQRRFRHVR